MDGGVYKRGNLYWIYYQQEGKQIRESSGSRFRADAVEILKKRQTQPIRREYTISDMLDMLIQDYIARGKKAIYKSTSHMKPLYENLGKIRVGDLTSARVEKYQEMRRKTYSTATVNRECQLLGQAVNTLAFRHGIISKPIYIRKLEEFTIRRDFFEPYEVEVVISHLPDYLQDYVRFAHISGWRKTEIATLTWEDVSDTAIRLNPLHNKTGDSRLLPLIGELQEIIARRSIERVEKCPYIFHRRGEYIRDFRKSWRKALKAAGYEGRVFHAIRRSSIRNMVRAGTHEDVAMKISGHKTRSVFSRYNITAENDIIESLQKTENYRLSQKVSQSAEKNS